MNFHAEASLGIAQSSVTQKWKSFRYVKARESARLFFYRLLKAYRLASINPVSRFPQTAVQLTIDKTNLISGFCRTKACWKRSRSLSQLPRVTTVSQLALEWALRRSELTTCIVGASRPSQLEENAAASGLKLAPEAIEEINIILG